MRINSIALVLAAIISAVTITGCAMGNKGTVYYTRTTTVGQELLDLQQAKDKNALTEEEYEKAKADILKSASCNVKIECSNDNNDKSSKDK